MIARDHHAIRALPASQSQAGAPAETRSTRLRHPSTPGYGTLGRAGVVAWLGIELLAGRGEGMPTSSVPARAFRTASSTTVRSEPIEVAGRDGTAVTEGAVRLSAPVKSPVTERR